MPKPVGDGRRHVLATTWRRFAWPWHPTPVGTACETQAATRIRSCENPFSHEWAERGFSAQREVQEIERIARNPMLSGYGEG